MADEDIRSMPETSFQDMIVEVVSVEYSSSIAIVTFSTGGSSFQLFGDRRMTEALTDYIGNQVRLFVRDVSNWSWQPIDEGMATTDEG